MNSANADSARLHFQWLTILINALSEIDARLKEEGLPNTTQASMLLLLGSTANGIRIGSLARDLHLRPNTTTAAINILEETNLVTRAGSKDDRRGTTLTLTEEGKKVLSRIDSLLESYYEDKQELINTLVGNEQAEGTYESYGNYATYCILFLESRRLVLDFSSFAKPYSINLSSLRVLIHVGLNKTRQRMIDISSDLNMHQNVLSISSKRLIDRNYIAKKVDSTDKRAMILSILPRGRKVLNSSVDYLNTLTNNTSLSLDSPLI